MGLLNWNHKKVQNLTPLEIWMFIAGRVFVGFGAGVLAMRYYPQIAAGAGIPVFVLGILLLALAGKGLVRKPPNSN
jgi:hypothetical protein